MRRIFILLLLSLVLSVSVKAQERLNVAKFFSDEYAAIPEVTLVSMSYDKDNKNGVRKYKSISVSGNSSLSDKISRAVSKDGATAVSKEVSYREGELYFGFYSLGGKKSARRYLLYLNKRPTGIEKSTLIYIEGDLDDKAVKALIK